MKHKLTVIGCVGMKRAYLDITEEEAIRRYKECDDYIDEYEEYIETFEFDDEFSVYEAWR